MAEIITKSVNIMLKTLQKSYAKASSISLERKNIKYPRIVIKADLSLFVRVPMGFSSTEVQQFINTHHLWIQSHLDRLSKHTSSTHSLLQSHHNEILIFGVWQHLDSVRIESSTLFTPTLKKALQQRLYDYIIPRAQEFSARMNLAYKAIKITNATSRFGSCTYDNRLFFSFMLIFAPHSHIDYVIIHELAHIRHKNHSFKFWNLVLQYCPNAKTIRKDLREQARIYPFLLEKLSPR
ncbi:M48 family metallopeptidase [Helicobacter jaachi]|nr:SprT family zinc-dependent metalloprotease [Helicobacter jaachi]